MRPSPRPASLRRQGTAISGSVQGLQWASAGQLVEGEQAQTDRKEAWNLAKGEDQTETGVCTKAGCCRIKGKVRLPSPGAYFRLNYSNIAAHSGK